MSGRSVLITGASRGIGRQIALSYAAAGVSKIAILARSSLDEMQEDIVAAAEAAGHPRPNVLSLQATDITVSSSVKSAARRLTELFDGHLDILVNNAGYLDGFRPLLDTEPDSWWKTFEVNVKGVYLVAREFLPTLLKTHDGLKTIINISSIGAHLTTPGASAYETTKTAVLRLTDFWNTEYSDSGLLTYSVHPGGVATDLGSNMPSIMHEHLIDTPALAGDTIVFLSKERREWLAGRYVSVNWDMEDLLCAKKDVVEKDLLKIMMKV